MKKSKKSIFLLIIILLSISSLTFGNSQFLSIVQRVCASYQLKMEYSMMSLLELPNGNQELTITMNSTRNNFDKSLLVGYYAAGKAIQKTNFNIESVIIIVNIEYKSVMQIISSVKKEDVLDYSSNKIDYSDFMKKVTYL